MKKLFLIIAVVFVIGAGFWWTFRKSIPHWLGGRASPTTNSSSVPLSAEDELAQRAQQATFFKNIQRSRDSRRLDDIHIIEAALESYRQSNNETYPEALSQLVPEQFAAAPRDPSTGVPYQYTRTAGTASYAIVYTLEVGVQNIAAGTHTAIPGNIAAP